MRQFIESLESRTLFSVTLLTDQAAIVSDAAAIKTAVKNLAAQNNTLLAAITVDLKTLPKTNAPLLKTVKSAAAKLATATASDETSITTSSGKLAKKSVTDGDTLLTAWTPKGETAIASDATTLNSIVVAPLGKLQLDLNGPLVADLGVILTQNPTATKLASDINALDAAYAAASAQLTTAATQYQTGLTTLASDLAAIPTIPNILFNYAGSSSVTAGAHKGKSTNFTFDVTVESANGSWTATFTTKNKAGVPVSKQAQGTLDSTGALNGTLSDGTQITGIVNGKTIKGTEQNAQGSGPFSITHP